MWCVFFFFMIRRPPRSTLSPYTTLSRALSLSLSLSLFLALSRSLSLSLSLSILLHHVNAGLSLVRQRLYRSMCRMSSVLNMSQKNTPVTYHVTPSLLTSVATESERLTPSLPQPFTSLPETLLIRTVLVYLCICVLMYHPRGNAF